MEAIALRIVLLVDAPPVAIICLGGDGIPNLSAWARIERSCPSIMARTLNQGKLPTIKPYTTFTEKCREIG